MAEAKTAETQTTTSHMQHFSAPENVKKMFDEQSARVSQMFEELGKAHSKWIEYGNSQIDEMNELMKTQFNYANELAAGMRKLALESVKKTVESFKS